MNHKNRTYKALLFARVKPRFCFLHLQILFIWSVVTFPAAVHMFRLFVRTTSFIIRHVTPKSVSS